MGCPVVHWELAVLDGPRMRQFYAQLFDWRVNDETPTGYGLVDTGGAGGIDGGIGRSEQARGATIYVRVDDLEAYLQKVERMGGRTLLPPTAIPDVGTLAMFEDPEGNRVGLIKG